MNNRIYHMAMMAIEEKPTILGNFLSADDIAVCCQNIFRKLSTQGGAKQLTIETQLRTYDVKVRNGGLSKISVSDFAYIGTASSKKAWHDVTDLVTYEEVSRVIDGLDEALVALMKQEGGLS